MKPTETPTGPTSPSDSGEPPARHLRPADLREAARLATEATLEGTRLVEAVHAAVLGILRRSGPAPKQTAGLTGWVYRIVRRIARLSGRAAEHVFGASERLLGPAPGPDTEARRRLVAALNGVIGDRLAASDSPLAQPFSLRAVDGTRLDPRAVQAAAPGPLVVFVHGLCMGDRAWTSRDGRPGLAGAIASAVGGTPVLARYNTGRSIRSNGQALSERLSRLAAPPEEETPAEHGACGIVLVGHSMGGLVVRSAALHARRAAARWLDRVQATVYLGTPHRGAPLERAGAWAQARLRRRAVTAPFASLAGLRSQGIQDLGRAAVAPDGPGSPGDAPTGGSAAFPARRVLCVAGAMAEGTPAQGTPAWDAVGDGLVPVSSALAGAAWRGEADRRVFEGVGHIEMLQAPAVAQHVCAWLAGPAGHGQITAPRAANP